MAEPSSIALTFMDEGLRDRIRLDSIMCVVDAEQVFAAPEMMELKLRQVAFADMLILNKVDLVTREEIEQIKAWLDDRFHRYRLVESCGGDVPLEILLSVGRFDPSRLDGTPSPDQPDRSHDCDDPDCGHHAHGDRHDHSQDFRTWSYETDEPLSLEALRESASKLPASVYRCKGVIHTAEEPGRRVILQVVGKRVDIAVERRRGTAENPGPGIVAIGADDGMDGARSARPSTDAVMQQPIESKSASRADGTSPTDHRLHVRLETVVESERSCSDARTPTKEVDTAPGGLTPSPAVYKWIVGTSISSSVALS